MMNLRPSGAFTCSVHPEVLCAGRTGAIAHLRRDHPEVLACPETDEDRGLAFQAATDGRRHDSTPEPAPYVPPKRNPLAGAGRRGAWREVNMSAQHLHALGRVQARVIGGVA